MADKIATGGPWQRPGTGADTPLNGASNGGQPLGDKLSAAIKRHFPWLEAQVLQTYSFKSHHSDYPQAKADLEVFDRAGVQVLAGRMFNSNNFSIWAPMRETTTPEWQEAAGPAGTAPPGG